MLVTDIDSRRGDRPAGSPCRPSARSGRPNGGPEPRATGSWTPLAGEALLDRLRFTGRPRSPADPARADGLRRCLEQGLGLVLGPALQVDRAPLVITKGRLNQATAGAGDQCGAGFGERPFTVAIACGALIDALFRQLVTIGSIGDPMADGLAALAIDDRQAPLVAWIDRLPGAQHRLLADEVRRQASNLAARWPALHPGWLPRTEESMRVGLVGGAVELSARVDLAVGRPGLEVASVAIVEVKSGMRRPEHRHDLHFYALVEALRNPAPPFVVATYYTRTGELDVEPVDDELLASAARRTLAGAGALVRCPDQTTSTSPAAVGGDETCTGLHCGRPVGPTAQDDEPASAGRAA